MNWYSFQYKKKKKKKKQKKKVICLEPRLSLSGISAKDQSIVCMHYEKHYTQYCEALV